MYDYLLVFLSTMVVTAYLTSWLYQDELQALEELRALKTKAALKTAPASATIAAPKTPSNIPTLSREKHDECTRLREEWNVKHAKHVKDCTTVESNAEHDAAIKAKKFPEREYIYSDSILPHERTPTHLTRSMQEWWEFERKHSAAPIGSWIHYENPKVQGETTIRVTYAILRIDAPERWQERVYFYHVGETCCC
jgi:hypothetical protein